MTTAHSLPEAPHERRGESAPKRPKVRRDAGWKLLEERFEDITVIAGGRVRVPSRTHAGRFYTTDPSRQFCPCPDSVAGANICAHVNVANWALLIGRSGYTISRHLNSRAGLDEWHIHRGETTVFEGVRYSLAEAILERRGDERAGDCVMCGERLDAHATHGCP